MILYGSSISPFVRKVLAFAAEKGIALELDAASAKNRTPEFMAASPFGKMPALRDGDYTLADSTAIIAYLEAVQPQPNLIPTEPQAHGKAVWFEEFADTILCGCGTRMFFNRIVAPMFMGRPGDEAVAAAAEKELPAILDYLERTIPASGWLVEDRLTLADISVATAFVNLMHLGIHVDPKVHPTLAAYVDKMLSRPAYAGWVEQETAFFKHRRAG